MLILSGHRVRVHTLAFSPDGLTLASLAGRGNVIWLWDLLSGQPTGRAEHERRVVSVAFAPGADRRLACSDSSGNVTLWDLVSGRERFLDRLEPVPAQAIKVAFSPDGALLAASGTHADDARWPRYYRRGRPGITLWEPNTGEVVSALSSSWYGLTSLAFSPDGKTLAAGGLDFRVHLWNVSTGQYLAGLNHGKKVHFVAFSPDGRLLASATPSGLIKLWDAETGRPRFTLKGQGKELHALACSPDGHTLATASGDGTVRFWAADTGRSIRGFDWGVGPVHSVAFAPDGMRAAAGGARDIIVWDIDGWGL